MDIVKTRQKMNAMDTCTFGLLLLSHLFVFLRGEEVQPPTLEECCEAGRVRALRGDHCSIPPLVSASHICRSIQEQCCVRALSDQQCTAGITMAMEQRACNHRGERRYNLALRMCCGCCVLGLGLSDRGLACELSVSHGSQCEQAAMACCAKNDMATQPAIHESNCSQLCLGTTCGCLDGYQLKLDGINCEDVDECLTGSHSCTRGQMCINIEGSFQCNHKTNCDTGYQHTDHDCQDIDECVMGSHNCGPALQCTNTAGSFLCHPKETACSAGFIRHTAGTCIDIDECATGGHTCSGSQSCFNLEGAFRCLSFDCPSNFLPTSDGACVRVACDLAPDVAACRARPLRISFHSATLPVHAALPAHVFRLGAASVAPGDDLRLRIASGDEEGYFGTERQAGGGGGGVIALLRRPPRVPRDFLLTVEMTLTRYGTPRLYEARVAVFVTREPAGPAPH